VADARDRSRVAVVGAALALMLAVTLMAGVSAPPAHAAARPPVLAYYYIWFNPSSWNRAKTDYPSLGRYSSDDVDVIRRQIRWAKSAGIEGFLVSWKSTPTLDRRLAKVIRVADEEHFKLGIVYEGLDFSREPLSRGKVAADLEIFEQRYASNPAFRIFRKPLVIWAGTWRFSPAAIKRVTAPRRAQLKILATEKNAVNYERIADSVDGDAYYWSSVNPSTYPGYPEKLIGMGAAVHQRGGLWIPPAAPGFDARLVGGSREVPRAGGSTLRTEMAAAMGSAADAVGLISWNEFSENTYVEPSRRYGAQSLQVLASILGRHLHLAAKPQQAVPASKGSGSGPLLFVALLTGIVGVSIAAVRRRDRALSRAGRAPARG
jgi:Glycosyl hydrolase family 99